jgi:hypothetical protein
LLWVRCTHGRTGSTLNRAAHGEGKGGPLVTSYPEDAPRYASYLLRLRWATRDGRPTCQATLIDVVTKEQRSFADLEGAMAYLREQGALERVKPPTGHAAERS